MLARPKWMNPADSKSAAPQVLQHRAPSAATNNLYGRDPQAIALLGQMLTHNPQNVLGYITQHASTPEAKRLAETLASGGFGDYRIKAPSSTADDPDWTNNTSGESMSRVGENVRGVTMPHKGGGVSSIIARDEEKKYEPYEKTALHEMVHGFLMNRYGGSIKTGVEKAKAAPAIQKFMDDVKHFSSLEGRLYKKPGKIKELVGLSMLNDRNYDEGIAYLLTNKSLQDYLKTVDMDGRALDTKDFGLSAWDKFSKLMKEHTSLDLTRHDARDYLLADAMRVMNEAKGDKPNFDTRTMEKDWVVDEDPTPVQSGPKHKR
jgi:hypothetical protein